MCAFLKSETKAVKDQPLSPSVHYKAQPSTISHQLSTARKELSSSELEEERPAHLAGPLIGGPTTYCASSSRQLKMCIFNETRQKLCLPAVASCEGWSNHILHLFLASQPQTFEQPSAPVPQFLERRPIKEKIFVFSSTFRFTANVQATDRPRREEPKTYSFVPAVKS